MPQEGVEFTGGREFDEALDRWTRRAVEGTQAALAGAGAAVADEARKSFDGSGGHPRRGGGALEASIVVTTPKSVGFEKYEAQVGPSGVVYARRVELGKKGAHSARPHPYLQPGFKRAAKVIGEVFHKAWAEAGKR